MPSASIIFLGFVAAAAAGAVAGAGAVAIIGAVAGVGAVAGGGDAAGAFVGFDGAGDLGSRRSLQRASSARPNITQAAVYAPACRDLSASASEDVTRRGICELEKVRTGFG